MKLKQFKTCPLFFSKTRVQLLVCLLATLLLSGCKNTPVEPINAARVGPVAGPELGRQRGGLDSQCAGHRH